MNGVMTKYATLGHSSAMSMTIAIVWDTKSQLFTLQTCVWKINIAAKAVITAAQVAIPRHLLFSRVMLTVTPRSHGARAEKMEITSRKAFIALPFCVV